MEPATHHPRPSRAYDLRPSGLIYVAITLLIALGGFNSQNNLLFWAFSFALAILLVSGLLSGHMLMGIRVQRRIPAHAVAGRPLTIRYRIANRNRLMPAFALEITEATVPASRRTRFRFAPRAARRPATLPSLAFVQHISPRSDADAEALLRPASRGLLTLRTIRITSSFPFGIIGKVLRFSRPARILVHPQPILPAASLLRELGTPGRTGRAIARRPGHGHEFFSLREYTPGDRPCLIAWRASARRDDLLVRQTSPPAPTRLTIVLDFPSDLDRALAETAISQAAGLIAAAADSDFEVGLDIPHTGLIRHPRPGAAHAGRLLDDLALLDLDRPAASDRAPRTRPDQPSRSPACVVIHAGRIDTSIGPPTAIHLAAPCHGLALRQPVPPGDTSSPSSLPSSSANGVHHLRISP